VNQQSRGQHDKQSLQGVLTSHKASHKESKQATYLPLFCRCFADLMAYTTRKQSNKKQWQDCTTTNKAKTNKKAHHATPTCRHTPQLDHSWQCIRVTKQQSRWERVRLVTTQLSFFRCGHLAQQPCSRECVRAFKWTNQANNTTNNHCKAYSPAMRHPTKRANKPLTYHCFADLIGICPMLVAAMINDVVSLYNLCLFVPSSLLYSTVVLFL
jgi:hypothetical protein